MNPLHKAFIQGCCYSILLFAGMFLVSYLFIPEPKQAKNKSNFQVIDRYEDCDVILYTDPTNRWHYLLKCS